MKSFWTRDAMTRLSEVIVSAIAGQAMAVNAPQPAPHPPYLEEWRASNWGHSFVVVQDPWDNRREIPISTEFATKVLVLGAFP